MTEFTPTSVGSENGLTIATWVRRERTAIDKDYLFDCQGCDRDDGQACGAQSNKGFWMFVMFNRVLFYGMKNSGVTPGDYPALVNAYMLNPAESYGDGEDNTAAAAVPANTWSFLSIVHDGTGSVEVTVDGVKQTGSNCKHNGKCYCEDADCPGHYGPAHVGGPRLQQIFLGTMTDGSGARDDDPGNNGTSKVRCVTSACGRPRSATPSSTR